MSTRTLTLLRNYLDVGFDHGSRPGVFTDIKIMLDQIRDELYYHSNDMTTIENSIPLSTYSVNKQTGTSYTAQASDRDSVTRMVEMNNAAPNTLTVPPDTFNVGDSVNVCQTGTGATTIAAGAGVTINYESSLSLTLKGQYAMVTLYMSAANVWIMTGATA